MSSVRFILSCNDFCQTYSSSILSQQCSCLVKLMFDLRKRNTCAYLNWKQGAICDKNIISSPMIVCLTYREKFVVFRQTGHHLLQPCIVFQYIVTFCQSLLVTTLDIVCHCLLPVKYLYHIGYYSSAG